MVRPSARAVFRVTMSSNLVGCSIGKTPALSRLKMLSTYPADQWNRSSQFVPIGHQPAVDGEVPWMPKLDACMLPRFGRNMTKPLPLNCVAEYGPSRKQCCHPKFLVCPY